MKARLIALIVIVLGLGTAAIWWGSVILLAACVAVIVLIGASIIVNRFASSHVNAQLSLSENSENNGSITITVHLSNGSTVPVLKGLIVIEARNLNFKINSTFKSSFSVNAGEEQDIQFHIESGYCGKYRIEIKNIRCYDIWGMTYKNVCSGISDSAFLFPGSLYISRVSEAVKQNYEKERKFAGVKNNTLSEILQYREYRKGDSLKNINWKLSTKHDQMLVREFDTPIDNKTLILFDLFEGDIEYQNMTFQVLFAVALSFVKAHYSYQVCWQEKGNLRYEPVEKIEQLFYVMRCIMSAENDYKVSAHVLFGMQDIPGKYAKIIYISNIEDARRHDDTYEYISVNKNNFCLDEFEKEVMRLEA